MTGMAARNRGCVPELDPLAAECLAVLTLLISGEKSDADLATVLLDDLMTPVDRPRAAIEAMASISAALLALLEFFSGLSPEQGVQELGRIIAEATYAD